MRHITFIDPTRTAACARSPHEGTRRAKPRAHALLALPVALTCCVAQPTTNTFFQGTNGARFYAVGEDDVLHSALTNSMSVSHFTETSATELGVSPLPITKMMNNCAAKLTRDTGGFSVALIEPKSNVGVIWSDDNKVTIKREVIIAAQTRVTDSETISGGSARVVYRLTEQQFKEALTWFIESPCATPGDSK